MGLINNTSNDSWSRGGVLERRRLFKLFRLVFIQLTNGQKTMLALVEKPQAFLERTCSDIRKEIQSEIGKLQNFFQALFTAAQVEYITAMIYHKFFRSGCLFVLAKKGSL